MRLGGPIHEKVQNATQWATAHREKGYSAVNVPNVKDDEIDSYTAAAREQNLLLAEVGAWSNPLSDDPVQRKEAIDKCRRSLALADRVGARCCVNIAGSRGPVWDGPDPRNLTRETFDKIVEIVRHIIDAVKPTRSFYTLETMPWIWPDGPDAYVELLSAIDRKQFAVHLDPVNFINCPARLFDTGKLLRECFDKLGPHIRSCHAKDITIASKLTLHLDECRPGTGYLDYGEFLRQLARLDPDTPLMLEHLPNADEYAIAAAHIRAVAGREGIAFA